MRPYYSLNVFGKEVHDLAEADLQSYFQSERRETHILEFKSYVDDGKTGTASSRYKEKLNGVIKTLCAFLNSEGGILIWGAPVGTRKDPESEVTYRGALTPINYKLQPDEIIDKIASEISPVPIGIKFQVIETADNKHLYVWEVARSDYAPHQHKGTYFMRMDGSTRTAPHHYVEALMKKITYPRLEATLTFGTTANFNTSVGVPFVVTIHNMSTLIHDKNVKFRLLITGANAIQQTTSPYSGTLLEYDRTKLAIDVIHHKMPFTDEYILLSQRIFGRDKQLVRALLFVWGDQSPVISSEYHLEFFCDPQSVHTHYIMKVKSENVYLMDKLPDAVDVSEADKVLHTNQFLVDSLQQRIYNWAFVKELNK